jgi:O-methyltransferase involved in polyketide biosynthesis
MFGRGSDAISPTAHYTGHVWGRHGLSHPELRTREGQIFFGALAPAQALSHALGGPTLEGLLLARHRIIDHLLDEAIRGGRVSQVIEIACGMSPRGWRFAERYGDALTYVEADLPDMAERKRRALERIGSLGEHHRVVELDALRDDGPDSLAAVAADLDPAAGLAILTEGLVTYFDEDDVRGMWKRFARELRRFSAGLYLADMYVGGAARPLPERAFRSLLAVFVRGAVHTHFENAADAEAELRAAGFADADVFPAASHPASGDAGSDPAAERIHIVEATC